MPKTARASVGGMCYHVLNRGNGRAEVFHKDDDYAAFLKLLGQAGCHVHACVPARRDAQLIEKACPTCAALRVGMAPGNNRAEQYWSWPFFSSFFRTGRGQPSEE